MGQMKTYSLWMEGYITQGNSSKADFLGTFKANSFIDACDKTHTCANKFTSHT